MDFPVELLVHCFRFLDATGYFVVTRTCKLWNALVETNEIWQQIVDSLSSSLSDEWKALLLDCEASEAANYGLRLEIEHTSEEKKKLFLSKTVYRFMATCFFVGHSEIKSMEMCCSHSPLRRKRFFNTISEALSHALPGDFIHLGTGHFSEELVITTPVHIFGTRERVNNVASSSEPSKSSYYLRTTIDKSITWACNNNPDGDKSLSTGKYSSSLNTCCVSGAKLTISPHTNVAMSRSVCKSETSIKVLDNASFTVWGSDLSSLNNFLYLGDDSVVEISDTPLSPTSINRDAQAKIISSFKSHFEACTLSPQPLQESQNQPHSNANDTDNTSHTKHSQVLVSCARTLNAIFLPIYRADAEGVGWVLSLGVLELFYAALQFFTLDNVRREIIAPLNRLILSNHSALVDVLPRLNFVGLAEEIIRTSCSKGVLEWICVFLYNLIDRVEIRQQFTSSLYEALLKNMAKNKDSLPIVFETISFFWPSAHRLLSVRDTLINGLDIISSALDTHKSSNKLYHEVMGLIWNLPGVWPSAMTSHMLPHILHALSTATNFKRTNTALGAFLIAMPNMNLDHIEYLLDNGVVNLLLQMKQREYITDEAQNRLWKTFVWLGKHNKGQQLLSELVYHNLQSRRKPLTQKITNNKSHSEFPILFETDMCKLLRALCIQEGATSVLFSSLRQLILETRSQETFYYLLDSVVHLYRNAWLFCNDSPELQYKSLIEELGSLLMSQYALHFVNTRATSWIGWANIHMGKSLQPQATDKVCMSPNKGSGIYVAEDGFLCRHSFAAVFGTTICSHAVTKGKWYFELKLLTGGLFQLGWATSAFKPTPEGGNGVGDDKNSWAVDLKRHAKWHENEHGALCQPYGEGIVLQVGDILQAFLDVENKIMSFGYNGKDLGTAFSDFHLEPDGLYVALSMNLENECLFNFGPCASSPNSQFIYPPPQEFMPLALLANLVT